MMGPQSVVVEAAGSHAMKSWTKKEAVWGIKVRGGEMAYAEDRCIAAEDGKGKHTGKKIGSQYW